MRRMSALLLAAGLAATPASAVANPSGKEPSTKPRATETVEPSSRRLGVTVMVPTPELRKHLGAAVDRGVIVSRVVPGSPAALAGVAVGDVIVEVRGTPVDEPSDLTRSLFAAGKGTKVAIVVVRDEKPLSLQATMTDEPLQSALEAIWPGLRWWQELLKPTGQDLPKRG